MENLNSVCYINKINKIEAIEGADKLELATVNGWTSVVQKGIHKEGDLILCITTDAVIPEDLATKWGVISYLRNKSRVRTVKLRGVYSECILIPLIDLPISKDNKPSNWLEGRDYMEILKIFKYEPPVRQVQLAGGRKIKYKDNPNFEVYYKFPNQKNVPNMFSEDDEVIITRKMHGTNARYGIVKKHKLSLLDKIKKFFGNKWIEYEYVYGSHNVQKGSDSQGFYSTDVWREVADNYNIKEKLWNYVKNTYTPTLLGKGIIIYGEIFGPGIQGELYDYRRNELHLELFDIEFNGEYLNDFEFQSRTSSIFKSNLLQMTVEYLYEGKWSKEVQDHLVHNQYFTNSKDKKVPHEGVVVKCITGDRKKISKVINPEYLTFSEKNNVEDSH